MFLRRTLLLIIPILSFAQSESYQLGGYGKYLYSNANIPIIGRVNDHIFHSRINSKVFLSEELTAVAELRNRIFLGGSVEHSSNFLSTIESDHDFGNVDVAWWNTSSSVAHSELDRFYIDATVNNTQFTLGRQRVAWGTALVWNPTDLFNPLSILDFDYEERPGVDALRGQYFLSEVSKIEIAVKPGKSSSRRIIAAKILLNQWDYDFHIISGVQGFYPFFGAAWAGDIEGAGFRGEIASKKISAELLHSFPAISGMWSTSVVLSIDYTFSNNIYLHSELLYNDQGVTERAAFALPSSRSLGLLSPARLSLFYEISLDVHPLVRLSGFIIYNPYDHSSALVPSASWSVIENLDISFFGLIFSGHTQSEYGGYGQTIFLRAKYSF
ncbi:MAG: hypothetical protein WCW35_09310 [Bacteroidota bacterium]